MRNTLINKHLIPAAILTAALGACGAPEGEDTMSGDAAGNTDAAMSADTGITGEPQQATATLYDADGKEVGRVIAMQGDDGVSMNIMSTALLAGSHGAHIHETGTCEPDFMAAGDHWGPFDAELNLANDVETDDSENAAITVRDDGTGELAYALGGDVTLAEMLEGDGSAFVVHQRPESPAMTTPSGEGDRVACGVFEAGPE